MNQWRHTVTDYNQAAEGKLSVYLFSFSVAGLIASMLHVIAWTL